MGEGFLIDKVQDKTGMKGTGKWTIQQAAELSVAAPTMEAALDGRFLSGEEWSGWVGEGWSGHRGGRRVGKG